MEIRRATDDDIPTVAEMWTEAAEWLASHGYDQWQYPVKMHNIEAAVAGQNCWLVEDGGKAIGTVTLDEHADPSLWLPGDKPADALYLHRLVVRRENTGGHLGSAIIDWASQRAARLGKAWLRLDAWSSNTDLHRYYLNLRFRLVRVVEGADVVSGVLFERPAGTVLGRGPALVQIGDDR